VAATSGLKVPAGIRSERIELTARATGGAIPALILHPASLPDDEANDFIYDVALASQAQWLPAFGNLSKKEYDREWEWYGLWRERFHRNKGEPVGCVAVISSDLVQGLMITGPSKETNLPPGDERLLYVAHMATAPWNRQNFRLPATGHPAALRGVGTALMRQAVLMSEEYGYGGKIGLHAMGSSWRFYRKLGLTDLGKRVKDKEFPAHSWYEFSNDRAVAFLEAFGG